jgi:ligand-binding sensor domain-containing protein/DNA-binding CsgD family transcriptional regulator
MLRKISITLIVILVCYGQAVAEIKNIGTPFIRNFSKSDYRAGTQSWGVAQDLKGFIYFANNDGLLVYDGVQWQVYRMPNLSMVRSVYADYTGEVYVGAYNDIGKMIYSENGKMTFSSLRDLVPQEYRNFDDVWNIFSFRNRIVFQSYYATYFYSKDSPISVVAAPSRFQSAYSFGGRLIFNDDEKGLLEYDENELVALNGCSELIGQAVSSVLPFGSGNEILICTEGKGLFIYDGIKLRKWDIPVNESLIRNQIFSATVLQDKYYALGTILDGVIIIDQDGRLIQHINKKKGLQNNTILDLFPDRAGNLWLALDNGIDYVTVNSPVTFIQDPVGFGAGYASVIYEGRLYLGTNQGLYVRDWEINESEGSFTMIPGTYGQVWYLGVHNGILMCGHDKGTFIVSGERAEHINNIPGGWKYLELKQFPGFMIGGTYSGIILFRWEQGSWKFVRQISGFNESFRVFEEDDQGNIWMSHGFKGIFRVRLSDDLETVADQRFYTVDDGLPLNFYLSVFRIKGKIIIASEKGIFEYVPDDDRFVYSVYFNHLLSPLVAISYLREDQEGNIWYVSDNRTGVFRIQEDFSYQHVTTPFILLSGRFIHGFESIYPYSPWHLFFGTENGFAHYAPQEYFSNYQQFSAYITRAEALYQDSVFYYGRGLNPSSGRKSKYSFPYKDNSFRFTFSSPVYDNAGNTEYSYRLSGFGEEWSQWSRLFFKEYSNLPDGHYSFEVIARNQLGTESLPDSLEFEVMHPWYKSLTAFIAYMVITLSLILLIAWIVNRRIEISRQRERINNQRIYEVKEQEYIQQALQAEKEIIRIKNENLNAEMILRDKELANQAMNMVRKNEFLLKLKEELNNFKNNCQDEALRDKIIYIVTRINREVDSNKQREVFENAFDEVNEDFMNKLNVKYPMLTPAERRLCAFIKMNISTKEIAPLMNISVRGVEICRYRIRKKMGITRDTNLTGLLLDL